MLPTFYKASLLIIYYVPGMLLDILHALSHALLPKTL